MVTDAAPRPRTIGLEPLPSLSKLARLLGRQAACEELAEITAGQPTNRLSKFHSENGDG